jgi:hypothetical protein
MTRKRGLVDFDGLPTGNSWTTRDDDDVETGFRSLIDQEEVCHFCGYDGPLRPTRKGYKCPKCREIVLPAEV